MIKISEKRARFLAEVTPHIRPIQPGSSAAIEFIDSTEFLNSQFHLNWLVENCLVDDQPGVIGGPSKACKTGIALDLAVSLASATPFLGHFNVPVRKRVAFLCAESGQAVLQNRFRAVLHQKGIESVERNQLKWCFRVPKATDQESLDQLSEQLRRTRSEVVILDPLYLCLTTAGKAVASSDLYAMGPMIEQLSRACLDAGAMPILVHHFTKSAAKSRKKESPPELSDLSQAGIGEFARQWILVGKRNDFDPESGKFELIVSIGGSAWGGNTIRLDIEEGTSLGGFGSRYWLPRVLPRTLKGQPLNAANVENTLSKRQQRIIRLLHEKGGETLSVIRKNVKGATATLQDELKELKKLELIEETSVPRAQGRAGMQPKAAWKLTDKGSDWLHNCDPDDQLDVGTWDDLGEGDDVED